MLSQSIFYQWFTIILKLIKIGSAPVEFFPPTPLISESEILQKLRQKISVGDFEKYKKGIELRFINIIHRLNSIPEIPEFPKEDNQKVNQIISELQRKINKIETDNRNDQIQESFIKEIQCLKEICEKYESLR